MKHDKLREAIEFCEGHLWLQRMHHSNGQTELRFLSLNADGIVYECMMTTGASDAQAELITKVTEEYLDSKGNR